MSLVGFTELGSHHEPHVAPPTVSAAEAHHWRGASFSSERIRRPSSSSSMSNIMDAPVYAQSSLPAPLLPTLASLQSSSNSSSSSSTGGPADMVRMRSDPGYQIQLNMPLAAPPPPPLHPFTDTPSSSSAYLSSSGGPGGGGGALSRTSTRTSTTSAQIHRMSMSEQELEEPDLNPLYLLLSTSDDPELQTAWFKAGLVLVPPRHECPPTFDMMSRLDWIMSHAFEQDFSAPQASSGAASSWSSLGQSPIKISLEKGRILVRPASPPPSPPKAGVSQQHRPAPPPPPSLNRQTSQASLTPGAAVPFPSVDAKEKDEEDEDEILIPFRPSPRAIPIQTETTVYRRKPLRPEPVPVHTKSSELNASVGPTKSKPKFGAGGKLKTPKWLQRASFSRSSLSSAAELARSKTPSSPSPSPSAAAAAVASSDDLLASSPTTKLEMLRVVALEEQLIPWQETSDAHLPSAAQTPLALDRPDSPPLTQESAAPFGVGRNVHHVPATRNITTYGLSFLSLLRFKLD